MRKKTINQILQETTKIYNEVAVDFSRTRYQVWPGFTRFKQYLKPHSLLLDVGCGNGRMAEMVKNEPVLYRGIDASQALIELAENKFQDYDNIHFAVGDVLQFNLPANQFDVVFLLAVIHHLPSPALRLKALKNIQQALKDDGVIILSSWNLWQPNFRRHLFNLLLKYRRGVWAPSDAFVPWKGSGGSRLRYVHSFTQREMRRLLKRAGFEVKEIYFDRRGKKSNIWHGENLIVIAGKCYNK